MLMVEQAGAWPPWRAVAYAWFLASGVLFSIYGTVSLRTLTEVVQAIFYIALAAGSLLAAVGAVTRREVVELGGALLLVGPNVAFTGLLFVRGFTLPAPDSYATLGLACWAAGTVTMLVLIVRGLWKLLRAAKSTPL